MKQNQTPDTATYCREIRRSREQECIVYGHLPERTMALLHEALRLFPDDISLLRLAVETYYYYENPNLNAVEQLTHKILLLAPTDPQSYFDAALCASEQGESTKAIDYCRQGLAIVPDHIALLDLMDHIYTYLQDDTPHPLESKK